MINRRNLRTNIFNEKNFFYERTHLIWKRMLSGFYVTRARRNAGWHLSILVYKCENVSKKTPVIAGQEDEAWDVPLIPYITYLPVGCRKN